MSQNADEESAQKHQDDELKAGENEGEEQNEPSENNKDE